MVNKEKRENLWIIVKTVKISLLTKEKTEKLQTGKYKG